MNADTFNALKARIEKYPGLDTGLVWPAGSTERLALDLWESLLDCERQRQLDCRRAEIWQTEAERLRAERRKR